MHCAAALWGPPNHQPHPGFTGLDLGLGFNNGCWVLVFVGSILAVASRLLGLRRAYYRFRRVLGLGLEGFGVWIFRA